MYRKEVSKYGGSPSVLPTTQRLVHVASCLLKICKNYMILSNTGFSDKTLLNFIYGLYIFKLGTKSALACFLALSYSVFHRYWITISPSNRCYSLANNLYFCLQNQTLFKSMSSNIEGTPLKILNYLQPTASLLSYCNIHHCVSHLRNLTWLSFIEYTPGLYCYFMKIICWALSYCSYTIHSNITKHTKQKKKNRQSLHFSKQAQAQ